MAEQLLSSEAAQFVSAHYGGRASTPELIGAGEWSQAYAFTLDGQEAIIRFGKHGEDFAKDALMGDLTTAGPPIPKVLELGETAGGYFAVSERRHGEFLDVLEGAQVRAVLPSLLTTLDAIRSVNISGSSGYGGWSRDRRGPHDSWAEALLAINEDRPRIGDWRRALEQSPVGAESFGVGFAKLRELADDLPDERQLIHGDLLNRNVLVNGDEITAVFDWGNAMYGDALYDAAWLLYWWPWFPSWSKIDIRETLMQHWEQQEAVPVDLNKRLLAYQLHIGLDHLAYTASIGRWEDLSRNDQQVRELLSRS